MTTPKKKHLIELMIEAGVEWPEDAKYATQDKDTMHIRFYEKDKPFRSSNVNYWDSFGGSMIRSVELPELCSNWHQTIVTSEQYAKAVAAINNEQKPQYCTSVMRQMPSETIESLLAEIKAKREEHGELVVKVDALAIEITSIEQQVNDKLKEYGFSLYPIAASSEIGQTVITDWRDLRVGDVVEHVEDNGGGLRIGSIGKISKVDKKCINVDYENWKGYSYGVPAALHKFKFIRRP